MLPPMPLVELTCTDARHAAALASTLRHVVDGLQLAACGSAAFDAQVRQALASEHGIDLATVIGLSWSTDLGAALALLPEDHNFSVGRRDGVCWAWIQPNDSWVPAEYESRHDHPRGSGLTVANTAPLAFTSAALMLLIRQLQAGHRTQAAAWPGPGAPHAVDTEAADTNPVPESAHGAS